MIVLATLAFVVIYANNQQRQIQETQTEAFINMTVAMEHVTTNYLIGEQRVCDSWARHINTSSMTAEEAVAFLCSSVTDERFIAHVLFAEGDKLTGEGLSTVSEDPDFAPDNLLVNYGNIDLFPNGISTFFSGSKTVYVTRTFNNPISGRRSIAFCKQITLKSSENGAPESAVLLRIIPESAFKTEWSFPTDDYKDAEITLINAAGDYVISGDSFQSTNFFEFYQYYNERSNAARDKLARGSSRQLRDELFGAGTLSGGAYTGQLHGRLGCGHHGATAIADAREHGLDAGRNCIHRASSFAHSQSVHAAAGQLSRQECGSCR